MKKKNLNWNFQKLFINLIVLLLNFFNRKTLNNIYFFYSNINENITIKFFSLFKI